MIKLENAFEGTDYELVNLFVKLFPDLYQT